MNPLAWKREHQIALALVIFVGAVVGCIFGCIETPSYVGFRWGVMWCDHGSYGCWYLLQGYWLLILFWTLLGGFIGGAIVYVRQLLQK